MSETFVQINKELRRDFKSLRNRLQSILYDHDFLMRTVVPTFPNFPIVPNERCGLWYCSPNTYEQTSYFKSTDGHINQWDFSTRRLNFHLFPILIEKGGVIIVDSTRRGKKIPDALSKTVPIWCAVLNGLMLEATNKEFDIEEILFVPPGTIAKSERDRIVSKIPELMSKLQKLNIFKARETFESLNGKLLRPFWVYPGSSLLEGNYDVFTGELISQEWEVPSDENIIPIILCTISYQAQDGVDKKSGFTYLQGAADDHELWSCGLEPNMFWSNIETYSDSQLTDNILEEITLDIIKERFEQLSLSENQTVKSAFDNLDCITENIWLGKINDGLQIDDCLVQDLKTKFCKVIVLSETVKIKSNNEDKIGSKEEMKGEAKLDESPFITIFPLQSGSKKSSKELRKQLPNIDQLASRYFKSHREKLPILVCCNDGKDMSIGVILYMLAKYYKQNWQRYRDTEPISIDKMILRKHLTQIISHLHGRNVNPSRATLNSVNSFLM